MWESLAYASSSPFWVNVSGIAESDSSNAVVMALEEGGEIAVEGQAGGEF